LFSQSGDWRSPSDLAPAPPSFQESESAVKLTLPKAEESLKAFNNFDFVPTFRGKHLFFLMFPQNIGTGHLKKPNFVAAAESFLSETPEDGILDSEVVITNPARENREPPFFFSPFFKESLSHLTGCFFHRERV